MEKQQTPNLDPSWLLQNLKPFIGTGSVYQARGDQWLAFPFQQGIGYVAFSGPHEGSLARNLRFKEINRVSTGQAKLQDVADLLKSQGYQCTEERISLSQMLASFYLRPDLMPDSVQALYEAWNLVRFSQIRTESAQETLPWT